jgi:hypothetical protein
MEYHGARNVVQFCEKKKDFVENAARRDQAMRNRMLKPMCRRRPFMRRMFLQAQSQHAGQAQCQRLPLQQ